MVDVKLRVLAYLPLFASFTSLDDPKDGQWMYSTIRSSRALRPLHITILLHILFSADHRENLQELCNQLNDAPWEFEITREAKDSWLRMDNADRQLALRGLLVIGDGQWEGGKCKRLCDVIPSGQSCQLQLACVWHMFKFSLVNIVCW